MNKIFNKKGSKNDQGFTLIELVVAMALIVILSSIIITTASFSDTQKNLNLKKNELQAAVRLAQGYSLSIPNTGDDNICGFGLYVKSNDSYAIYYTYDSSGDCSDADNDPAIIPAANLADQEMETFNLNSDKTKVQFSSPDDTYVFFSAPYGDVVQPGFLILDSTAGGSATPVNVEVKAIGQIL